MPDSHSPPPPSRHRGIVGPTGALSGRLPAPTSAPDPPASSTPMLSLGVVGLLDRWAVAGSAGSALRRR